MPEPIERKRLKKKMLDRWENEGGRIAADPAGNDDASPTNEREGKQRSASLGKNKVGGPASSTKGRKPTRK